MKQRKKQPEVTRQAILQAAGEEFARHGYAGTGLSSIVMRTGLTKGALFHHFPDKRALAVSWAQENLASEMQTLWLEPLSGLDSLDALRAFLRARCFGIKTDDALSVMVSLAAECFAEPVLGPALAAVHASWQTAVGGLLDGGKSAGWIHRSIQSSAEASLLVAAFCGFTVAIKCSPGENTRRSCAGALEGYLETLRVQ